MTNPDKYVLLQDFGYLKEYGLFMLVLNINNPLFSQISDEYPVHAWLDLVTTPDPMPKSPNLIKYFRNPSRRSINRMTEFTSTHAILSQPDSRKQIEMDNEEGLILKVERELGLSSNRILVSTDVRSFVNEMHNEEAVNRNSINIWSNNALYHSLRLHLLKIDPEMSADNY